MDDAVIGISLGIILAILAFLAGSKILKILDRKVDRR